MENIINISGYTLHGASVAGVHTSIAVKELQLGFDIGTLTDSIKHCDKILISHGHIDHCGEFFKHFRCRKMGKMTPSPIYFIPKAMEKPMQNTICGFFNMEKGRENWKTPNEYIKTTVINHEGYSYDINSHTKITITSHPMTHRIPSVGYIVSKQVQKLKPEYLSLQGRDIKTLRDNGVEIYNNVITDEIGYTGDTSIEGVIKNDQFLNVKILVMECTIIDDELTREKTKKRGHIHLDDIAENAGLFKNEHIILFHLSPRYKREEAKKIVLDRLTKINEKLAQKIEIM